jgi:Ca-activated chloride channel family protein
MRTSALFLFLLAAGAAGGLAQTPEAVFRTETRLVEIYATVVDHKGHYVDGIPQARFQVTDNGEPQQLVSFESNAVEFSCAILLDTTGSMTRVFPAVRNAILRLLDSFRDNDWVAVYGFSTGVELLQDFTLDKAAAKQAVVRARASGQTALYDAVSRVAGDVAGRKGKKSVVVFTDGDDNASTLSLPRVVERARALGIPMYVVAEGEALNQPGLFEGLKQIGRSTGAKAYAARETGSLGEVFKDIARDIQHTYLLAYRPPKAGDDNWRRIQVSIEGLKDYKVRAREGYFPE